MSTKERLLAALDTSLDDVSEEILVDILLEQLKQAKANAYVAQACLIEEGVRADQLRKEMHEREHRMRSDPLHWISGDFYFTHSNTGPVYVVSIGAHALSIRMFKREGGIDYAMRQISLEDFMGWSK